jgi:hypothetical protein
MLGLTSGRLVPLRWQNDSCSCRRFRPHEAPPQPGQRPVCAQIAAKWEERMGEIVQRI